MKKFFPYIIAGFMLGLDQIIKLLVRQSMNLGETIPVIKNIFHITYIENEGVAFGMFSGHTGIFIVLSIIILAVLLIFMWKEKSQSGCLRYGVALIVSGAIGNIIDRGVKASVTDMFDFRIWPVFNVADVSVCIGFLLLVIYLLFSSEAHDGKGEPQNSYSK